VNIKSKSNIKSVDDAKPGENQSLEYIFDVLLELVKIAKKSDEASLVYYLEMAALEAGERSSKIKAELKASGKN